jgi:hypothetical protein
MCILHGSQQSAAFYMGRSPGFGDGFLPMSVMVSIFFLERHGWYIRTTTGPLTTGSRALGVKRSEMQ